MKKYIFVTFVLILALPFVYANHYINNSCKSTTLDTKSYSSGVAGLMSLLGLEQLSLVYAANSGDDFSHYLLGKSYLYGIFFDKNLDLAQCWLDSAAKKGFANAYHHLGILSLETAEPTEVSINYFNQSIDAASELAKDSMFELGLIYKNTSAQHFDIDKSVKWYSKADTLGQSDATFNLALIYHRNEDHKNIDKAISYYQKSESGKAKLNLAAIYIQEKQHYNPHKALNLINSIRDEADGRADFFYGWLYFEGEHVKQDMIKAKEAILTSAKKGYQQALNLIDEHPEVFVVAKE